MKKYQVIIRFEDGTTFTDYPTAYSFENAYERVIDKLAKAGDNRITSGISVDILHEDSIIPRTRK